MCFDGKHASLGDNPNSPAEVIHDQIRLFLGHFQFVRWRCLNVSLHASDRDASDLEIRSALFEAADDVLEELFGAREDGIELISDVDRRLRTKLDFITHTVDSSQSRDDPERGPARPPSLACSRV